MPSSREGARAARGGGVVLALTCLLAAWVAGAAVVRAELRDPFVFGPRREAPGASPSSRSVLTGIVWDAAAPLAVIDGEPFVVGQTVEGWRIAEIQPDHIVLQRGEQLRTLVSGDPLPVE